MMQSQTQAQTNTAKGQDKARHTLDSLAAMSVDELGPVYATGTVPSSLAVLDGHPQGRMLAVKKLDRGPLFSALSSFAGAKSFPWGGKSFTSHSASTGAGINRVHLAGRHNLFPFHTRFAPSVVDGRPCVVLDYDLTDNPGIIRKIHDEIREVSPGLFLGPAMWKTKDQPIFVLWFALDTRAPAAPIGAR